MGSIAIFWIVWLVFGVYTAGTAYASFQGTFPYEADRFKRQDMGFSLFFALGGPFTALVALFCSGFNEHGWGPWGR